MEETPKEKKWDHLAIRPDTYETFKKLNKFRSQNKFVVELLNLYQEKEESKDV